jgi:hypothetical protein
MSILIEPITDNVPFVALGGDERRAFFLVVATQNAKKVVFADLLNTGSWGCA